MSDDQNLVDAAEIRRIIAAISVLAERIAERFDPISREDHHLMLGRIISLLGASTVCMLASEEYLTATRLHAGRQEPVMQVSVQ